MFLTQITVDTHTILANHLFDNYKWKKELCKTIETDRTGRPSPRFRILEEESKVKVLLLTKENPKPLSWGMWETKHIPKEFYNYKQYEFNLRANPTFNKNGCRKGVKDLFNWIKNKGDFHGFKIIDVNITPKGYQNNSKKNCPPHFAAEFKGVLEVVNPIKFKEAACMGIGSAKAFGFGVLLLKPLNK